MECDGPTQFQIQEKITGGEDIILNIRVSNKFIMKIKL